ncbi:transglutaminase-like cysteine peptidase [Sneathiella limimaris]|uniref:transglutaminase-like cysteine peptidase n=1 Tax=Sneathiella limimaris TaxID=1964213 RepID=UPI00146A9928|nr:transglutaminase-like cysteine peptidase [Sneathiella limimaris]
MKVIRLLLLSSIICSFAFSGSNSNAQDADGLFGTLEIASSDLQALPQWRRALASFSDLKKAAKACDEDILKCNSQQMTLWRTKIQELEHSPKSIIMRQINQFVNKWQHNSDWATYRHQDYWASPLEFLTVGGDSEDFAIMKYVSLKELGFSSEQMRIVVTRDVLRGVTHTILSVQLNNKSYVLDSQTDTVFQEKFIKYYVPLYSLNETTRWAHIPSQYIAASNAARIDQ